MLGPLCNETVNLNTDFKTLYYSMLELKCSLSILKHNKCQKKYASVNKSHNNCHRNYTIRPVISKNTHVQIDQPIFLSYRMHVMNYFASLGIFMRRGRRTQR